MFRRFACVMVMSLSAAAIASAADKVPNPQYEAWAKFKPGAFVKLESSVQAAGTSTKSVDTTKLVEVTPDKLTLELVRTVTAVGKDMVMPPQKIEVPAKIDKPEEAATKPKTNTGEETIKVGEKDVKTNWTEATSAQGDTALTVKTWNSPEVPGGLVKMTSSGQGALASRITTTLVDFATGQ